MEVVDKRADSASVPAVGLLGKIIPFISPQDSRGIRRVVLCDEDYHKSKREPGGRGRYLQINGTNQADVEIYLGTFSTMPESLQHEPLFLTYHLAKILLHELYHHSIRSQHRRRQPKFQKEQDDATRWAEAQATAILHKVFPPEDFKANYERITELHRQAQEGPTTT